MCYDGAFSPDPARSKIFAGCKSRVDRLRFAIGAARGGERWSFGGSEFSFETRRFGSRAGPMGRHAVVVRGEKSPSRMRQSAFGRRSAFDRFRGFVGNGPLFVRNASTIKKFRGLAWEQADGFSGSRIDGFSD